MIKPNWTINCSICPNCGYIEEHVSIVDDGAVIRCSQCDTGLKLKVVMVPTVKVLTEIYK